MEINYNMLPEHMREGARLYIEKGIEPGGFMTAVLENKFVQAFSRADDINLARMKDWASWLYNECPMQARGSERAVKEWLLIGGLEGQTSPKRGE